MKRGTAKNSRFIREFGYVSYQQNLAYVANMHFHDTAKNKWNTSMTRVSRV